MKNPLLILPFDHRGSFKKLIGSDNPTKITELKTLIFAGFLETISKYENKEYFGVLVDEEFGTPIIEKAQTLGITTAIPVEKSGQDCFDFEYGEQFGEHIEKFKPTYVKTLVRYNPQNKEINQTQLTRLQTLSDYCQNNGHKLLFELLVPATTEELANVENSKELYDTKLRPTNTIKAIKEIKENVVVDTWKLEWFEKETWQEITNATGTDSKIIVLGRGEDTMHVEKRLTDAAPYAEVVGFAVGRTVFIDPLTQFIEGTTTKEETASLIGENYENFVKLWFKLKNLV